MEATSEASRRRTVFFTLLVIGLLVALTWWRAKAGRAQWGAHEEVEPSTGGQIEGPAEPGS